MIRYAGPFSSGAAVGANGAATANADTPIITGKLISAHIKYNDAPPAGTTDVVIKTKGTSPAAPEQTILSIANAATDVVKYPMLQACGADGAGIAGFYSHIALHDVLNISIAGANAGDSVTVWLKLED